MAFFRYTFRGTEVLKNIICLLVLLLILVGNMVITHLLFTLLNMFTIINPKISCKICPPQPPQQHVQIIQNTYTILYEHSISMAHTSKFTISKGLVSRFHPSLENNVLCCLTPTYALQINADVGQLIFL